MNQTSDDCENRVEPLKSDGGTLSTVNRRPAAQSQRELRHLSHATICVVGLGYVGLPLAVRFGRAGFDVIGFDIDESRIETLQDGVDLTGNLESVALEGSDLQFSADPSSISSANYVIIAVPTPIDDHNTPNLSYVEAAGRMVGRNIQSGTTIILESTVYPGATHDVLVPAIEESSGGTCGLDFFIAYSPERATPGDPNHTIQNVVKVVSAEDPEVLNNVTELYDTVVDAGVHPVDSIEAAEMTKLVENIQRDVNIALVNELTMAVEALDLEIDTAKVFEAAATKWNFHEYRPGLVGGHCIPVDPYYFIHRAKRNGYTPSLVETSRDINESMPAHVGFLSLKLLNDRDKPLKSSRVLVLGLTYKSDVADTRSSKIKGVIDYLSEFEISVAGYDPIVDPDVVADEFGIEILSNPTFSGFDLVIFATNHGEFDNIDVRSLARSMADRPALLDVCGAVDSNVARAAGFEYRRL